MAQGLRKFILTHSFVANPSVHQATFHICWSTDLQAQERRLESWLSCESCLALAQKR